MNSIFPVLILFLLCMLQTQAQTGRSDNTVMIASENRGSEPKRAECGSRGTLGKKCINRRICTKEPGTKPTCKGPKSLEIEPNFYCGDRNSVGRICKRGGICIRRRKRFRCKRENPVSERPPPLISQKDTGILLIGQKKNTVQSYGCKITPPVDMGSFGWGGGGGAVLNGKPFIYNYYDNKCYHGSLESSGDWVVIEKCLKPKIRTWASWIGFGNFILVTGGFASPKFSDLISRFDGTTWTTLNNKLTTPRDNHCSVAISDNEMIVLGGAEGFVGSDPIKHISTVEKYNIDGKLIQTLQSMNTARDNPGCTFFKKELYVAGGFNTPQGYQKSVEVYNLETNKWRQISNMNSERQFPALHVINNRLTVIGGFKGFLYPETIEEPKTIEYLDKNGNWKKSADSLEKEFQFGFSVQLKCPALN